MSNVKSLTDAKKAAEETVEEAKPTNEDGFDFAATMAKNKEKADRLKKDKEKANKGVIRSYRLKH